jgi:hypothetical protein
LEDWTTIAKFDISIGRTDDLVVNNEQSTDNSLHAYTMSLADGSKYICSVPEFKTVEKTSETRQIINTEESIDDRRAQAAKTFESTVSGKCVRKSDGR